MIKSFFYIVGLFLISGCFGGYSPDSTFYVLKTVENVAPISNVNISVGVDLPELPEYVDKPQIVSFSSNNSEININETNRWGDELDVMLQRTIARNLQAYLPKSLIKSRTSLLEKYRYILSVSVVKFDMVDKDKAYFGARWNIKNGYNFKVVHKGEISLTMIIKDGYRGYANAMSQMVGQMCEQIAQNLIKG